MLKKEVAVILMQHLVNHSWHGYSQVSRWGDGEGVCEVVVGRKTYTLEQGDRDCSSAVISAYEAAGVNCGGASYTGNMRKCMTATGNFVWHPMGTGYIAKPGDLYLKEGAHTAMCLSASPDLLMEFSISETGGIDGKEGDQTGWESHTRAYYSYPWDGILECVNKENADGTVDIPTSPAPAPANDKIDIEYAVMAEDGKILPFVKNTEDYAGIRGKKILGFACRVNKGTVKYRVCTGNGKWLPYVTGCDWNDFNNGWAGNGKNAITCVEVYLYSPNGDKCVYYKVSPVGKAYYPAQRDNFVSSEMDGYAGSYGVPIDRILMWCE